MSALRLSRPGFPTELIILDEGAVGRVTHTRYGLKGTYIGGALVTEHPKPARILPSVTPERLAQMAEYRARVRESCAKPLVVRAKGRHCARAKGHGGECASQEALTAKALRQRTPRRGQAFSIHPENRR